MTEVVGTIEACETIRAIAGQMFSLKKDVNGEIKRRESS